MGVDRDEKEMNGCGVYELLNDDDEKEEVRILVPYTQNPSFTKNFWRRHFGTDFLVSAYLFLMSTVIFTVECYLKVTHTTSITPHTVTNAVVASLFCVGCVYFVRSSYPETLDRTERHTATLDLSTLSFMERYFTANDMLIAMWLFSAGAVLPYCCLVIYELLVLGDYEAAIVDILTIILGIPLIAFLNLSAMPDAMQSNNGNGSSFFFDKLWVHLLCLNNGSENESERKVWWARHLGNDCIAGAWIFAIVGIVGAVLVISLVIVGGSSVDTWLMFWSAILFTLGCLLLVRASYPENANKSLFFSSLSVEEED